MMPPKRDLLAEYRALKEEHLKAVAEEKRVDLELDELRDREQYLRTRRAELWREIEREEK